MADMVPSRRSGRLACVDPSMCRRGKPGRVHERAAGGRHRGERRRSRAGAVGRVGGRVVSLGCISLAQVIALCVGGPATLFGHVKRSQLLPDRCARC